MLDPVLIRYVTDPAEAARRADQLAAEPVRGVDIETYAANAHRDRRTGPAAVLWVTVGDTRKHKPATARTTAASMGCPRVTLWGDTAGRETG